MKTLILVRHAKSSRDDPAIDDFDRPLKKRGERDIPVMGRRLAARAGRPDGMVASPARRALETAVGLAKTLDYPPERIATDRRIYEADAAALLDVVREMDPRWRSAVLVGHNPGLTDLAEALTGGRVENLPTCGLLAIECAAASWKSLAIACGRLTFVDNPRQTGL